MVLEGNANLPADFLDEDEIEGVSDHLHDWTFEQAVMVAAPIDKEDRTILNWYSPNGQRTPALIKKLADDYEVSYRLALQSAHAHGMAILTNANSEPITLMTGLQSQLAENFESGIFDETGKFKNCFVQSHYKMVVVTDFATADMLSDLSVVLRTPKVYLSTAAVLYSLRTSSEITQSTKDYFTKQLKSFESGLKTLQLLALGNV